MDFKEKTAQARSDRERHENNMCANAKAWSNEGGAHVFLAQI
jgi:hypothetical protein